MELINFDKDEFTKKHSKDLGKQLAQAIIDNDGDITLDQISELVKMKKIIDAAMKDERIKQHLDDEFDKHPEKTIDLKAGSLSIANKRQYNFKNCGDEEYNSLIEVQAQVKDMISKLETKLKSTPDAGETRVVKFTYHLNAEEHGEMTDINPPVITNQKVMTWKL